MKIKAFPSKMLLCTNQAPSEVGIIYNRVIREVDSLSSNSFCIYAIDTKEKNLHYILRSLQTDRQG